MSQLLAQKRLRLGDEEDDSENSDEDEDEGERVVRAGYIRKLTLRNFMCHDYFELDLGPQMNFIIGRNGSGKSAILTGISVGLGAKAADTSRGSSFKSLIKDGKSTARITIEIDNDGYDSYEKETYGKVIIIQRKLLREGANTYSIRSENGSVVSNKKKTLDDILQKFFIMVNNPLSFLSQDKAREFIASSTEQSRFNYFSEGTNIQSILRNYQEASRNILSLQNRSAAAKDYYEQACKKYAESERAYKKYKHSHTLRQQLEKINGKIFWYNVEVLERRIRKKESEIKEMEDELSNLEKKKEQFATEIERDQEQASLIDKEASLLREKLDAHLLDLSKSEVEHAEATKQIHAYRADLLNYKREIEEFGKTIEKYKNEIEFEQKKIDDANGGSKEKMAERLEMLQKRQQMLIENRDELQEQLHTISGTSPEMESLTQQLEEHRIAKAAIQKKILDFERNKNNKYAAFGHNIAYLMRDIEKETRWHSKPIGPVGCFVSVKEGYDKWTDLINATLQKTLDSFVVCDEHDRRLLNQYMRGKKIFKNIIVRKFEAFAYNGYAPEGSATVLDTLDIHNDDVKFTLIDSSGVEEMVICESMREAELITQNRNVKHAFCLKDRSSGVRVSRRDGQLSRDPIFYSNDLRRLAGKELSHDFQGSLEELNHEEARIHQKRNKLKAEEQAKKKNLQTELEKKKKFLKEINNQIFNLERLLLEEGDHGKIDSLKEQIIHSENQIKTREGMSMELLQNLNESKKEIKEMAEKLQGMNATKQKLTDEITEMQNNVEKYNQNVQLLEAEIEGHSKKQEEILIEIRAKLNKKESDEKKYDELKLAAEEHCLREEIEIADSDTTESITNEFRAIQNAIEEAERNTNKTFEEIQNEVLQSKELKDKCETSLNDLEHARVTLENDLNSRFDNLNITIKEKLTRAKLAFEQCLALRGFKGKLEFDFGQKRVVTEVQTKDDKDTRAVLSLSGGEKSFTQIAFLLSIWKVMKPRVCGLDEFDVFMDSVNRTIAIRLLIHELQSSNAQSIFITPQDIAVVGDLKDLDDVRIHRIKAPRDD